MADQVSHIPNELGNVQGVLVRDISTLGTDELEVSVAVALSDKAWSSVSPPILAEICSPCVRQTSKVHQGVENPRRLLRVATRTAFRHHSLLPCHVHR